MGDAIIITIIATAVFFILRSRIRKLRRGQCGGGCAGCSGSCCDCMGACVEETEK